MDVLVNLAHGFAVSVTPVNLLLCLVGAIVGTAIGVLPGLGPTATISLLLPVTLSIDKTGGPLAAGASDVVTASIIDTDLPAGTYTGYVRFTDGCTPPTTYLRQIDLTVIDSPHHLFRKWTKSR